MKKVLPAAISPTLRLRLTGLAAVAGSLALFALPAGAQSTDFPNRAIHFVVPYAPGGTTDLVARTVGQKVAEKLGKPVIIENRPGAGGNIGMDAVAKAAPDGYTVGFGAISTNALNPHIYKRMSFDPRKDFTAISLLGTSTIVLQVSPQLPVKTVAEFISYAKKQPAVNYGTAGVGTSMHLAAAMFANMTSTNLTHVSYKGSTPAINDMLGGHLMVMFENLPASLPHIQAGKIRPLAVAGQSRSPSLPDVPTMAESGVAGYELEPWFGLYGPGNMPAAVVQTLNRAFTEALAAPDVKEKLLQAGFSPRGSSASELAVLTQKEYDRLGKVAREAQMTAD